MARCVVPGRLSRALRDLLRSGDQISLSFEASRLVFHPYAHKAASLGGIATEPSKEDLREIEAPHQRSWKIGLLAAL